MQELLRHTPPEDSIEANAAIRVALASVHKNGMRLNESQDASGRLPNSKEVWSRLRFEPVVDGIYAPELLGKAILCGSLHVGWMAVDDSFRSQYYSVFLFKSCVVIASVEKSTRYTVKFLIPLCCTRLIDFSAENTDTANVGMQSSLTTSFKLLFEYAFGVFEILLTPMSLTEKNVWVEQLLVQICANGGGESYDWQQFSVSRLNDEGAGLATVLPSLMRPLWVSTLGSQVARTSPLSPRSRSGLTFPVSDSAASSKRTAINIEISHFAVPDDEEFSGPLSARMIAAEGERLPSLMLYGCEANESLPSPTQSPIATSAIKTMATTIGPLVSEHRDQLVRFSVTIKLSDRLQVEKMLSVVWSRESLPLAQELCVKHGTERVRYIVRRISGVGSFAAGLATRRSASMTSIGSIEQLCKEPDSTDDENEDAAMYAHHQRRVVTQRAAGEIANRKNRLRSGDVAANGGSEYKGLRKLSGRLSSTRFSSALLKVKY